MTWINVEDELPKPYRYCWIYWKNREVLIGFKTCTDCEPDECWYGIECQKSSWSKWWMPLVRPEPPEV